MMDKLQQPEIQTTMETKSTLKVPKRPAHSRKPSLFEPKPVPQLGDSPFDLPARKTPTKSHTLPLPQETQARTQAQQNSQSSKSTRPPLTKVHTIRPSRAASLPQLIHFEKPLPLPSPYDEGFKLGYRAGMEIGAQDKHHATSASFTVKDSSSTTNRYLKAGEGFCPEVPRWVLKGGRGGMWGGGMAEGYREGWSRGYWNGIKIGLTYENKQEWEKETMVEKGVRFGIEFMCDCCESEGGPGEGAGLVERSGNRMKGV